MPRFTGKTVLVTGASSGIGEATARLFHAEGAQVVAIARDRQKLDTALGALAGVVLHAVDLATPGAAQGAVTLAVDRFGRLDVLINNAGIARQGDVEATDDATFDEVLRVNVGGYFHMAKAAMPHLRKTRGNIVMTSSVSGIGGDWGMLAYDTSKGAVTNMVRAMALDAGAHGVRVNAVNPTMTNTGMTKDMQDAGTLKKFEERIPMKRIGQPDDIARVIAFLASDDAGFVTGVNLPVDGGLSASNGQPAQ